MKYFKCLVFFYSACHNCVVLTTLPQISQSQLGLGRHMDHVQLGWTFKCSTFQWTWPFLHAFFHARFKWIIFIFWVTCAFPLTVWAHVFSSSPLVTWATWSYNKPIKFVPLEIMYFCISRSRPFVYLKPVWVHEWKTKLRHPVPV